MKLVYWGFLGTLAFSGCAQHQYNSVTPTQGYNSVTPTQGQYQSLQNTVRDAERSSKVCNENLRSSEINPESASAVNLVDKQVLFVKDDSANKVELMASSAKITDVQKKALLQYVSAQQFCRNALKRDMQSVPTLLVSFENYFGDMDIVYAKLISKQITIGQANQEKARLIAKVKSDYSTAAQGLDSRYTQQINQEAQAAQAKAAQRRAIAAQYIMNQQNINAQQQMNYQNQLNNNRPVNTTCSKYGNQVNCTSQ
ncbi:hypothetical protein G6717_05460 [Polynucleobacter paneuropaeus]|nr:hypothetical protein [Polynucleobacter paneuropaeus]